MKFFTYARSQQIKGKLAELLLEGRPTTSSAIPSEVVAIRLDPQALKLHKNFDHFKNSLLVNKKTYCSKYTKYDRKKDIVYYKFFS